MLSYLVSGILLGLSAGFAPGPLLTLVISESLRHGMKSGIKVAIAPVLTDLPIIFLALFLISRLSHLNAVLGIISICGGCLVLHMAHDGLRTKGIDVQTTTYKANSLRKGIAVNALSPHPYLFWVGIGAPIIFRAYQSHILAAVGFVTCFITMLVGSKIVLAVLVGRSRSFLSERIYLVTMRILGILLGLFALLLFYEGFKLLGWV